MNILVTGACGFVGSTLIRAWAERGSHTIIGVDNFSRPGSERNRDALAALGVVIRHADLRLSSDLDALPRCDAVIDAAANPSVLGGVDRRTSSRQLVEHNLIGTVNVLEYCRAHQATLVVLSTSRVYSIPRLTALPVRVASDAFELDSGAVMPASVTPRGITETFSTEPPLSLYGSTKLASEQLALEYGAAFDFPVWINRCGVLAGAGQFGRADQGIFSFWINAWLRRRALRYIGFGGHGHQVRDCLHPLDLIPLLDRQLASAETGRPRVINVSGGPTSARSLAQVSSWCRARLGDHSVEQSDEARAYDLPWVVLDATMATEVWGWHPRLTTDRIFDEILEHARAHPDWLDISARG